MAGSGDIAIVGLSCLFPGASGLAEFWHNIVTGVDAVGDAPAGSDVAERYDPDAGPEGLYCQRGGYLRDLATFDPAEHGVMPRAVDGGEPEHFVALRLAREALADAGYLDRPFDRERAAVIIGRGTFLNRGNVTALQHGLVIEQTLRVVRRLHPDYGDEDIDALRRELHAELPPFNAETAPSLVSNVMCGRVANKLDLRGPSFAVDAACASSLIAVDLARQELVRGRCDLALAGGVNVSTPAIVLMVFCQLSALSRRGEIRPFDAKADGTLLGEGAGLAVLKRREDAERDGDRTYAVLRGIGIASDGHGLGVLAPNPDGQELCLRRAYEDAGVAPASVGLIECHGTGTAAGDKAEIEALTRVFGPRRGEDATCAIGTVKSMISHTIPAAGIAGLIKAALALHHKVLPPTLHCDEPNPDLGLERTPFYPNTTTRPWISDGDSPRRAAVSAFGFGGINAHVVLDETGPAAASRDVSARWEAELILVDGDSRDEMVEAGRRLVALLDGDDPPELADLAFTLACPARTAAHRLAVVAADADDLRHKLGHALDRLADPACTRIQDRSGIVYHASPLGPRGRLAFLFPGEGAQYAGMLAGTCLAFPEVRERFDRADRVFTAGGREVRPSQVFFPPPGTDPGSRLWETDHAVAGVFAAGLGLHDLLGRLGVVPDAVVGHSSGEFAALVAAGAVEVGDEDAFAEHAVALNALDLGSTSPRVTLMTVGGVDRSVLDAVLAEHEGAVVVTMDNCPNQVVVAGDDGAIGRARDRLQAAGALCVTLPFDRAYHTPAWAPSQARLATFLDDLRYATPRTALWSCATAARFPGDPDGVRALALDQWVRPVRFRETVEALHDDGVRLFVEVGPRGNLCGFVDDILRRREHVAVPVDVPQRPGLVQLLRALAVLAAHGVAVRPEHLFARRVVTRLWDGPIPSHAPAPSTRASASALPLRLDLPRLDLREVPRPEPARDEVMDQYADTMDRFLSVQQDVMLAALGGPPGEVTVDVELDPRTQRHLLDHTLGGRLLPSGRPGGLPVLPLSVTLDTAAAVAARLVPGLVLVGVRDFRAERWVELDRPATLRVHAIARPSSPGDVDVEVSRPGEPALARATFRFAAGYPDPPTTPLAPLAEAGKPALAPDAYYRDVMFHGPAFRSVERIERCGPDGVDARLRAPAAWSPEPGAPTDPVLLDAAGQLVGFWAADRLPTGFVIFPLGCDALDLYAPWPDRGTAVDARARTVPVGDSRLRSDIEFALPDDRPLLRASGWEDVRFDLPRRFVAFLLDSGTHPLSDPWPAPVEALGDARLAARRLDPLPDGLRTAGTGIWLRAWSHAVLDEGERAAWHDLPAAGGRRYEWLAARTAAKEAASALTGRHPVDIAIDNDSAGRPVAAAPVHLSLTHAAGVAAALVSPDAAVGLDVEPLARFSEVLEAAALTSEERALLASAPPAAADEWVLRLWCAKEAAAKAAGTGLAGTPRSLVIRRIDADGSVVVERSGPAAGPPFPLRVATGRDGDLVFASALFPIPKEAVP